MRAIWLEDGRVDLRGLPPTHPGPGQALLRPSLVGICGTDLELLAGYYAFAGVPGHEFVAVVEAAPDNPGLVGRRVVADINVGCGQCPRCLDGDPRHCPQRKVIGIKGWQGALAQGLVAPVANLRPVPEGLADEEAVFAEPLAAALEIAQQVHLKADMKLAVLGDGKLGLLIALALRHYAPGLLLVGRHPEKLAIAQAQGVATLLADTEQDGSGLGGFDLVVEATGRPAALARAVALTRPEGTIVLKTTSHLPVELDLSRVVVNEITLVGSRCGDLALALHFLAEKLLDVRPLIQATYPLEQHAAALDHAKRPGALKVLIRP